MKNKYKESGVDIDKGNEFIQRIAPSVKATYKPDVLAGVGGFGAHYSLFSDRLNQPVLVAATDGVGTKLRIAQAMSKFDTIGIDLVAMCINDIICSGAKPLFFLDYLAVENLDPDTHSKIVEGIAHGCKLSNCSLIGGETAELPGIYQKGDFDLAGFAVGIVDNEKIIDGSTISIGNSIIGISSSGIHSNGYSLVRKIIRDAKLDLHSSPWNGAPSLGEILLRPTQIYSDLIQNLLKDFVINGIAHITGGGLTDNIPRILPKGSQATISLSSFERTQIFDFLKDKGDISEEEMQRVFNLGIGMILIVPADSAHDICARINSFGKRSYLIGEIVKARANSPQIIME